jgi:hypothetical protein
VPGALELARLLGAAASAGCDGALAKFALFGNRQRFIDQLDKALGGIVAVLLLGAVAARHNDQDAVGSCARPPAAPGDLSRPVRGRRYSDIETQLNGGGYFVDVLSPWPARVNKTKLNFAFINLER